VANTLAHGTGYPSSFSMAPVRLTVSRQVAAFVKSDVGPVSFYQRQECKIVGKISSERLFIRCKLIKLLVAMQPGCLPVLLIMVSCCKARY